MEKKYMYNKKNHTIHIRGFCQYSKGRTDYIPFEAEDEAIAFDGRATMCKLCQKERDKKLEEWL